MRQLRWIDWALIFLTVLIMLIATSGAVVASEPQITLAPGTWRIVEFVNDENEQENLTITNISAPDVLLPYVVVSPTSIPPLSTENVTVQFAYVPIAVRQSVPEDVFAVRVGGLIVYLDCSVPLPENAENRWAALEARIDALQASFTEQMEGIVARITALESEPESENWVLEIESLRENVGLGFDGLLVWVKSELARIEASIPENSPPTDTSKWDAKLDNLETKLREERATADAQLRRGYEEQIADAEADAEYNTMMWSIGSALAVLGSVGGYFAIKKKFGDMSEKTSRKTPKRHSSDDEKGDDNPIKSQRKW